MGNIVFQIDGGIGKSIMATAICAAIKKQYPSHRLIVITGYPEVFLCNPDVDVKLGFGELSYFYEKYVEGHEHENKYFLLNPYLTTDFINRRGHLIEVWCEMFGIRYNGEMPKLYVNQREAEFYGKNFRSQKPIMVVQTSGGAPNQPNKYSWARDLPMETAQQIVNFFAQHYTVYHIRREDQPALQNTVPVQAEFRAIVILISMSAKRLFIDSFGQHVAAALGLPSVVCWIANTPSQFGYALHTNVLASPPTLRPELKFSQFSRFNIGGMPIEFPYNHEGEIFNPQTIADALFHTPGMPGQQRPTAPAVVSDIKVDGGAEASAEQPAGDSGRAQEANAGDRKKRGKRVDTEVVEAVESDIKNS